MFKNLVAIGDTVAGQRKRQLGANLSEAKEALREKVLSEQAAMEIHNESQKSKLTANAVQHNKRDFKKNLQENLRFNYETMQNLLIESVSSMFFESILLDDEFKAKFKDGIMENSRELLESMFDENLINMDSFKKNPSNLMKDLYDICEGYTLELAESKGNEDATYLVEIDFLNETAGTNDAVASNVKDKVSDVIKKEKEISEQNKEEIEGHLSENHVVRRKAEPSLFRSIVVGNSRRPVNESGNPVEEIKDMDMIFAESMIQYTLLETLNTVNLLGLNSRQTQALAFEFSYIK